MTSTTPCRALRLPPTFDTEKLAADLARSLETEWPSHFNTNDYAGGWTSLALYSASGRADDIFTAPSEGYRPTPLLERCDYFREVIDSFDCPKESVRLLNLAPGSVIHEHRDLKLAYEFGTFRLHVPIRTSPDVDFIVGGENVPMEGGECWYANFDLPHSVANRSTTPRVHLVIDGVRNAWTDELFAAAGYDFAAEERALRPDDETQRKIMAELERMDTDASRALLKTMRDTANEG